MEEQPNYEKINQKRKLLRRARNVGIEVDGSDEVEQQAKGFILETDIDSEGKKIIKKGEITKAKERIRKDREILREEQKLNNLIDIDSLKKDLEEDPKYLENIKEFSGLYKKLENLSEFRLKAVESIKIDPTNQLAKSLLVEANKKIEEVSKSISSFLQKHPKEHRAFKFISYKADIAGEGHIVRTESVIEMQTQIQDALLLGKPMFLHGPTGTGKTSIARAVAYKMRGVIPEEVYCNPETKQSDIWGKQGLRATEAGGTKTVEIYGPLSRAIKEGNVCILDEFTALQSEQLVFLKGILSKRPGDTINIPNNGTLVIQQGFQLILTANLKSDKNPDRSALPPEMANEFAQNQIYVPYQTKQESYDIIITRLLNNDGRIELSEYDLRETLKLLVEAFDEIQKAYNSPLAINLGELGLSATTKPPQLEKQVLNQRTIESIVETYKLAKLKGEPISFREHLDQRFKKEITYGEYSKKDRELVAKILASKGFLTTLTEEELDLPLDTLQFNLAKEFKVKKDEQIAKSRDVKSLTLKQIVEIDPFDQRAQMAKRSTQGLPDVGDEFQLKKEVEWGEKIGQIEIKREIERQKKFYQDHKIDIPSNFEQIFADIWNRNKASIEQFVQAEGYDMALLIPETIPSTGQELEDLHTKMTEGYNPTALGSSLKNQGGLTTSISPQQQNRLVLVHKIKELNELPILNGTINISPDDFAKSNLEGLSLPEYLVWQRLYFYEFSRTQHLDNLFYTWLPKTRSAGYILGSGFNPSGGLLWIYADYSSYRSRDYGFRLSRSFF